MEGTGVDCKEFDKLSLILTSLFSRDIPTLYVQSNLSFGLLLPT